MTNSERGECVQYNALRHSLRSDLQSELGFSASEAGFILNWFDPSQSAYLEHVEGWQRLLCQGAIPDCNPLAYRNAFGSYDIFHRPVYEIGAIHQVAKLVYKFHGVPRRETDMEEVKQRLSQPLPITLDHWDLVGIRECLSDIRPPDLNVVVGCFGPGATREGFNSKEKWTRMGAIPDVPPNLFRANPRDPWCPHRIDYEGETKIAEVPKTIKSNRIVSSEPAMRMFAQRAVENDLDRQIHRLFCGHVSLHDQERHNRFLSLRGACSIDLSDASDHVSCELVQAVLPQLWPVLAKVRSQYSIFPDGDRVPLSTFAPMGSGVCFRTMTLVILGICQHAANKLNADGIRPTWFTVYGDDVIVPVTMYDEVCSLMTACGLVVNKAKSCCTLLYRESCGRELFCGLDITPVYIRDPLESVDAAKVEQVCSTLSARAFPHTAETVASLAKAVRGVRFNRKVQRAEVLVRTSSTRQKIASLDGYDGLNRWFSVGSRQELIRPDEPGQQGVSVEVWTKLAWRYKSSWDYPYLHSWLVSHEALLTKGSTPQLKKSASTKDSRLGRRKTRSQRNCVERPLPKG